MIYCLAMPPKNAKKSAGGKAGTSDEKDGSGKKEAKGGTSVKVRHILCEKQVPHLFRNCYPFFLVQSPRGHRETQIRNEVQRGGRPI